LTHASWTVTPDIAIFAAFSFYLKGKTLLKKIQKNIKIEKDTCKIIGKI